MESDKLTIKNTADAANTLLTGTTIPAKLVLKNNAATAKTNAKTASDNAAAAQLKAEQQLAVLTKDQTHATSVLAALKLELVPLQDDVVVKTYLHAELVKADTKAKADKVTSTALKADYKTLMEDGEKIYNQALLKATFYTTEYNKAKAAFDKAKAMHDANKAEVAKLTGLKTQYEADALFATATCKEAGYAVAQAAEAKRSADATKRLQDVASVKTAYDAAKPKAVTGGAQGTLCGYPTPNADDRGTRPTCNDGLCCGAANKILLDGTKLTVESCQPEAATTYTFWPELPAGATVRPQAQTWRFYCISGAQQIAAAATTAMAAAYLMA